MVEIKVKGEQDYFIRSAECWEDESGMTVSFISDYEMNGYIIPILAVIRWSQNDMIYDMISIDMEYFDEMHNTIQKWLNDEKYTNGKKCYEFSPKSNVTIELMLNCKSVWHQLQR